jgi:hypothetical protein
MGISSSPVVMEFRDIRRWPNDVERQWKASIDENEIMVAERTQTSAVGQRILAPTVPEENELFTEEV